jgi:hypothetical protein
MAIYLAALGLLFLWLFRDQFGTQSTLPGGQDHRGDE